MGWTFDMFCIGEVIDGAFKILDLDRQFTICKGTARWDKGKND